MSANLGHILQNVWFIAALWMGLALLASLISIRIGVSVALTEDLRSFSEAHGIEIHGDNRSGHPAQTLLRYAEEGVFDLIVLGHKGHSGLWGRFLGHTTDKVSENAHCSVLIVR